MNTEIKTPYTRAKTREHKRRCIASFIHENTRAGRRTNAADIAAAYGWHRTECHSLIKGMLEIQQPTTFGIVRVVEAGKHVSASGWHAMTYGAILQPLKTANQ